jgi:hypothetical protein
MNGLRPKIRSEHRRLVSGLLAVASSLCPTLGAPAPDHSANAHASPEIWFSPRFESPDFKNLFRPDAPWGQAASRIKVFGVSASKILSPSSAGDLPILLADLRRRHIALQIGMLPLTGQGPGQCGYQVEGYSAAGQPLHNAQRLRAAAADVRYFDMDEPLYYGHVFNGRGACHTSIVDIAKDVAVKVKQVQAIYPDAKFGDVEPMGVPDDAWLSDVEQWLDAYQAATGQRLAFFRVDMQWHAAWRGQVQQLTAAVFQSWTPHPTHVLPETDPRTMTELVDQYLLWEQSHG